MKIYSRLTDNVKALEELDYRARECDLTSDRYFLLLVLAGVPEEQAEVSRAKMVANRKGRQ